MGAPVQADAWLIACALSSVCRVHPCALTHTLCSGWWLTPIWVDFYQLALWVGRCGGGFCVFWVWAGVSAWGCGSMCRVVFLIHIWRLVQLLYLSILMCSWLQGFFSVIWFLLFLTFWMCAIYVYLCVILIFLNVSFFFYIVQVSSNLASGPWYMSLFNKIEIENWNWSSCIVFINRKKERIRGWK